MICLHVFPFQHPMANIVMHTTTGIHLRTVLTSSISSTVKGLPYLSLPIGQYVKGSLPPCRWEHYVIQGLVLSSILQYLDYVFEGVLRNEALSSAHRCRSPPLWEREIKTLGWRLSICQPEQASCSNFVCLVTTGKLPQQPVDDKAEFLSWYAPINWWAVKLNDASEIGGKWECPCCISQV